MAGSTNVLLVDDDLDLLEMFQHSLPSSDLIITVSSSSEEAEKLVDRVPFAGLITDALPGHQGLIKHFRERNPFAPAIVLTGGITPEQESTVRKAGAELVLYKPVGLKVLRNSIVDLIAAARQRVERPQTSADPALHLILDLEQQLINAWVAADIELLDDLLGEDYVFIENSSPAPERKRERLRSLAAGKLKYSSAELKQVSAQHYGHLCIVNSIIDVAGERQGTDISGRYRSVRVYSRRGNQWRAVAGQLTRSQTLVA